MKVIHSKQKYRLYQFDDECIALEYVLENFVRGVKVYDDIGEAINEFNLLCKYHNMDLLITRTELEILVAYRSGQVPPLLL
jgi:hypothetical protein